MVLLWLQFSDGMDSVFLLKFVNHFWYIVCRIPCDTMPSCSDVISTFWIGFLNWFLFCLSRECLKLIPHKKFSFAKIWLLAAQFEIRQKNLKAARQILGNAIGMAPKDKVLIVKSYFLMGTLDKLFSVKWLWSNMVCFQCRYSKSILRLNYNLATLIGAEHCMGNILIGLLLTVMLGASLQSWKGLSVRQNVLERFLNLQ